MPMSEMAVSPSTQSDPLATADERLQELKDGIEKTQKDIKNNEIKISTHGKKLEEFHTHNEQLKETLKALEKKQAEWRNAKQILLRQGHNVASASTTLNSTRGMTNDTEDSGYQVVKEEDSGTTSQSTTDNVAGKDFPIKAEDVSVLEGDASTKRKAVANEDTSKRQRVVNPFAKMAEPKSTPSVKGTPSVNKAQLNDELLELAPTIIRDPEGDYMELHCGICRANTSTDSNMFLKGYSGFREHIANKHVHEYNRLKREGESDMEFVIRTCTRRVVSKREINDIIVGRKTITPVPPQEIEVTTPHVGRTIDMVVISSSPPQQCTPPKSSRGRVRSTQAQKNDFARGFLHNTVKCLHHQLPARTCFICEQKVDAGSNRMVCRRCGLVSCMHCEHVLQFDGQAAHGCKKGQDEPSIEDFEEHCAA